MRLRIAGYEEAAGTAYGVLRSRLKRLGLDLFFTNNRDHGGLAEFTTSDYLAFRDAYWHRDTQWFVSPVHRVESTTPMSRSHGWNHVLESVVSLERQGRASIPPRTLSRGSRLNRGWITVK
jgi:hypothetical protein